MITRGIYILFYNKLILYNVGIANLREPIGILVSIIDRLNKQLVR